MFTPLSSTDHPYYVGVQYHPEYISRPLKPSPPYLGLILAATNKLQSFLGRGCNQSPHSNSHLSESDCSEDEDLRAEIRSITKSLSKTSSTASFPAKEAASSEF